ncbi:hypothetical protein BKA65DRAFT_590247 [Rhexocercosporidium sp. MPI-PUGE-AT-0058]|nr:hypothetical protein BKA65DRAFT_590247 [Rhexocercosporidium sp. MPI-PUGE-AT-0058]
MPGVLSEAFASWPVYTSSKGEDAPPEELIKYKKDIVALYGEDALKSSWMKVCKELEVLTAEIGEKGTNIIPEASYEEMLDLSKEKKAELQKRGCFVVRGVVSEELATKWYKDLKNYYEDNKPKVTGWPKATPFVLSLYWSPTQLSARSHPHQLRIQRELNSWWHDSPTSPTTSPDPLSYADAVRIRPPKIPFPGLGPHIDAGSLCRWVDPTHREVYAEIFAGNPEKHDCYDLEKRKDAKQSIFGQSYSSSVLRAFQGWTALTGAGKSEGSLVLYPDVKTSIAYILLRPFFKPPTSTNETDIMDGSKWTFDISDPWFPGTFRNDSQYASPSSHPHLRMTECMVNIPKMNPGDTVWWHCDMLHAVEVDHFGDFDSSVAYVAATPTTEMNKSYMREQVKAFLDGGKVPKDFKSDAGPPRDESSFIGWVGEEAILSGKEGMRAAGLVGL